MNKINIQLLLVMTLSFVCCKAQKVILIPQASQSQTTLPSVENHLKGELDHSHETLDLVSKHITGEEILLGKINNNGTINFNLPEFDIRAQHDSLNYQPSKFQRSFLMTSGCKDQDPFAETPYDDIYSKKYVLNVKKYGINVAVLEAGNDSLATSSKYFWLYVDRAITYKDECTKINSRTNDIYANVTANIQFEKGWNFIEESYESIQFQDNGDSLTTQIRNTHFSKSTPESKKVKWYLRQIKEDKKIQTAKRLDNLTPLTKAQFEKWMPNKLGDLSLTTSEHGNPPKRMKNKNNLHLIYTNESQKKEIDLYVVDCAKSPDDMGMVNLSYIMEYRDKEEKDIKPYITQYNEQEKTTMLMYKVEDRIFVNASGVNLNAEELWGYIQKLDIGKLLKE